MATLDDILAATKVLAEKSDNQNGDSKPSDDLDVKKDDGSAAADTNKQIVEKETVVESIVDNSTSSLGKIETEKLVVENSSIQGNDKVGVYEKIEDGTASCTENGNKSDGAERNPLSADEEGCEKGEENGEKMEDLEHGFRVGDFVWGKIKSHPWWPGQVFDPTDASDFAMKRNQEGRLLVAFFGDGSCSWCLPSQLKPFLENFEEMSVGSSSKSFLNAVQSAVDDIGQLVESEMTCKCVENRDGLTRQLVVNAGIKDGVLEPEVEISRLCKMEFEPSSVLSRVAHLAKVVSVDNVYEFAVLRSWLSAFYRAKAMNPLPVYCEPLNIEGMEDKNKSTGEGTDDFSVPIEVPILGPQEDDWPSPTKSSGDKIYHRRKQKSVAELMEKNPRSQEDETTTKDTHKSMTSKKKKKKSHDEEVVKSSGRLGRKRKAEASESSKITTKKVSNAENDNTGDDVAKRRTSSRKPKAVENVDVENTSSEAKEEPEMVTSPRERKKSKYLSPPYTTPIWRTGNSSFKLGSVSDKIPKEDNMGESESVSKLSDEQVSNGDTSDKVMLGVSEDNKKIDIPVADVDMPVDELVSDIQSAALDPLFLSKEGCLDMVWSFASALRSAMYLHGSNYKVYKKCKTGSKRKSLVSKQGDQENSDKMKSADKKMLEGKKADKKADSAKSKSKSKYKKATEILDGNVLTSNSKQGNQENDLPGKEVKLDEKKKHEEKKGKKPEQSKSKPKKDSEGNALSSTSEQGNQENNLNGQSKSANKKRKREEKRPNKKPDSSKSKSKKATKGFDGEAFSGSSKQGNEENDLSDKKVKSGEKRKHEEEKMDKTPESKSKSKKVTEDSDGNSSCLVLKFIPEYPLPSKEEIMKLFGKHGKLNRKETRVATDSHSVRIVYKDESHTKLAFSSSVSDNPFGDKNVVSYWLELQAPAGSKAKRGSEKHKKDNILLDVRVIRQKLDLLSTTLENNHSKFSNQDKSGLRDQIKNLLENVESTGEKVRALAENYAA